MDNFDLRKYLTEGQLYENDSSNWEKIKGLQLDEDSDELLLGDSLLPIYFKEQDENPRSWGEVKDFAKEVIYSTFEFNVDAAFDAYKKGVEELEEGDWYEDEDRKLHDKIKNHKFEAKDLIQINDDGEYYTAHPLDLEGEFDIEVDTPLSFPGGTINYLY
tara:strand:- start:68 stop:547 length:480 start_codon:yes stop_codon:yes gene_type:complete